MRRKKDDKRVLRSGNGRQNNSRRIRRRKNNTRSFAPNRPPVNNRRTKKKRKANKTILFLMVLALIAFVIGAGIGVTLSLDDGSDDGPHYENVTKEMTTNLNQSNVVFDENYDAIDYNENQSDLVDYQQPIE